MWRDEQLYQMKTDEMMAVYREVAPECFTQKQAFNKVVKHKASRFYVLPHAVYCALKGAFYGTGEIKTKAPSAKRMYLELYKRLLDMSRDPFHEGESLRELCSKVVLQPAPEFYISPVTFANIFAREKVKLRKRHESRRIVKPQGT